MNKLIIFSLFVLINLANSQERYHVRFVVNSSKHDSSRKVYDYNFVPIGSQAVIQHQINNGQFVALTFTPQSTYLAFGGHVTSTSNSIQQNVFIPAVTNTNYNDSLFGNNVDVYIKYDADISQSKNPFDMHDRIFNEITFIDVDSNGAVGFYDLYKFGSDPRTYPTATYYWSDTNNDGNCDSGELFLDSNGASAVTQSAENIPIRAGLGDTDGDGVDEGEDEEEEELSLEDKIPAFAEFKNIVGLDGLSIPAQSDITFTLNYGLGSYTFQGFQQIGYVNSFRLALRDLMSLFFTWLFIKSIVKTFSEW